MNKWWFFQILGGTTFHSGLGFKFGSDMLDFTPEKNCNSANFENTQLFEAGFNFYAKLNSYKSKPFQSMY